MLTTVPVIDATDALAEATADAGVDGTGEAGAADAGLPATGALDEAEVEALLEHDATSRTAASERAVPAAATFMVYPPYAPAQRRALRAMYSYRTAPGRCAGPNL